MQEKVIVFGLLMECPYGEALESCLLDGLRKLDIHTKAEIVRRMPDSVGDNIRRVHGECLTRREN